MFVQSLISGFVIRFVIPDFNGMIVIVPASLLRIEPAFPRPKGHFIPVMHGERTMKKLRLDVENISVESFAVDSEAGIGTVRGNNEAMGAAAGGGTLFSWCNTCPATCDVAAATCGASCGVACRPTVNTPDCYSRRTTPCPAGGCAIAEEPGEFEPIDGTIG